RTPRRVAGARPGAAGGRAADPPARALQRRAAGDAGGRWAGRQGGRCGDWLTGRPGTGRAAWLPGPGRRSDRTPTAPLPASPRKRGEGPRRPGPARPLPRLRGRVRVGATGAIAPTRDPPPHATS